MSSSLSTTRSSPAKRPRHTRSLNASGSTVTVVCQVAVVTLTAAPVPGTIPVMVNVVPVAVLTEATLVPLELPPATTLVVVATAVGTNTESSAGTPSVSIRKSASPFFWNTPPARHSSCAVA